MCGTFSSYAFIWYLGASNANPANVIGPRTLKKKGNILSAVQHQAVTGMLLTGTFGTNFGEILFKIQEFSLTKFNLKMTSAKWRSFCLGRNVLYSAVWSADELQWGLWWCWLVTAKWIYWINSMVPSRFDAISESMFQMKFLWNFLVKFLSGGCHWMGTFDDKSTLVQVMAWCHLATSHYLRRCWPKSQTPYALYHQYGLSYWANPWCIY